MRLSHDRTGLPERSSFTLLRLSTAVGSCRERRAGIPPYGRPTRARENKLSENLTIRREAHAFPCSYVFVRAAHAMGDDHVAAPLTSFNSSRSFLRSSPRLSTLASLSAAAASSGAIYHRVNVSVDDVSVPMVWPQPLNKKKKWRKGLGSGQNGCHHIFIEYSEKIPRRSD